MSPDEPGPLVIHAAEPPAPAGEELLRGSWPSRLDHKAEVLDTLAAPLMQRGLVDEGDREWLYLCLDEIVVNAMLHGNEGDPSLPVEAVVACDETRWTITVTDRGAGFTAASLPDASDPESLLLEHGRGIRLLRVWLDDLTYWRGGSVAVLARRRADRPA